VIIRTPSVDGWKKLVTNGHRKDKYIPLSMQEEFLRNAAPATKGTPRTGGFPAFPAGRRYFFQGIDLFPFIKVHLFMRGSYARYFNQAKTNEEEKEALAHETIRRPWRMEDKE
jgi:hypothetical protein